MLYMERRVVLDLPLPPWMVWAWPEAAPLSTMGSIRPRAMGLWQGMRQKALAEPESMAAATEREATDFMVDRDYRGGWESRGRSE